MQKASLTTRSSKVYCSHCNITKKQPYNQIHQVSLVVVCKDGHVGEFPWSEWVHQSDNPSCNGIDNGKLSVVPMGSGEKLVKCSCGAKRSLFRVTYADNEQDSTYLSENLYPNTDNDEADNIFYCKGTKPWTGDMKSQETCGRQIKATFINDTSFYYPNTKSSIYIPEGSNETISELADILDKPQVNAIWDSLIQMSIPVGEVAKHLKTNSKPAIQAILRKFSDSEISDALNIKINHASQAPIETDKGETVFRHEEYIVIRESRNDKFINISVPEINEYQPIVKNYFSKITLAHKLRETTVLRGFNRWDPNRPTNNEEDQSQLFKSFPNRSQRWLPGNITYGEGIYLELNHELLNSWENESSVNRRIQTLVSNASAGNLTPKNTDTITPRFVLLHTLAHCLMKQLTFECGYSTAALRERIYVSDVDGTLMAGLLIYTSSGDSEGTLGGLVRMGKPGYLEQVVAKTLEQARWCSSDPICTESGKTGQGPMQCNLAACHNCGIIPETSCEEFNRFLDRGLMISNGFNNDESIAYFTE